MTKNQVVVAGLIDYDVVLSDSGFFISINGSLDFAKCGGYSINEAGCIVLEQEYGDVVLHPVPDMFKSLIDTSASIIFVRFENGELIDAKNVNRAN